VSVIVAPTGTMVIARMHTIVRTLRGRGAESGPSSVRVVVNRCDMAPASRSSSTLTMGEDDHSRDANG
jgi:hypothetical protein